MDDLTQKAIDASLRGDFKRAIELNKKILGKHEKDVEALNRLGCAYLEIGEIKKAKRAYKKGLAADIYNPIILKNLKKISQIKGKPKKSVGFPLDISELFLAEPGKTKVASLINLPAINTILPLTPGTPVCLIPRRKGIAVYLKKESLRKRNGKQEKGVYLGALPDDLSFHLVRLLKAGNIYQAYIKAVSKKNLTVFIKEVSRAKKFRDQPSFPEIPHGNPS